MMQNRSRPVIRTAVVLVAAPITWMLYFWLVYLYAEAECAFGGWSTRGRSVVLAATVGATGLVGVALWSTLRVRHGGETEASHLASAGTFVAFVSLLGVVAVGSVVLVVAPC